MSAATDGISIVICTKNRPFDLERSIRSLCGQVQPDGASGFELLVVDDGELSTDFQDKLAALLPDWIAWRYHRKPQPGLYDSLRVASKIAHFPVVLFLDDDVELEPTYLAKLFQHYRQNPNLAGVGGVDRLQRSSRLWRWYMRLFLYSSGEAGKLSVTGFAGSLPLWNQADRIFVAEHLYGCNMSFSREALQALPEFEWLDGYSVVSDLLLPRVASQHGMVLVDPELAICHFQSPTSRDRLEKVANMQIVQHAHMLRVFRADQWRRLLFFWTWLGLFLVTLPQGGDGAMRRRGYLAAVRPAWRILEG